MTGTTPKGVTGEQASSQWVRDMFGRVAGRYDLLNHLLSFNLDKRWRARTVERVSTILDKPGARVLDLCCGTGDLLLALSSRRGDARREASNTVLGSDFCHPMLTGAQAKLDRSRLKSGLLESDALALPFPSNII